MKANKKLLVIMSTVATLGCLAACGGSTTSSEIVSSGNNSVEESITSETSGNSSSTGEVKTVEINFWHTFGQTVTESIQAQINKFEQLVRENDGVNVHVTLAYQGAYKDINSKVLQGFSSANIPTITVAYPDHVADYINAEGNDKGKYVVDLDEYMYDEDIGFGKEEWLGDEEDEEDIMEAFFEEGRSYVYDGTYSMPFMKSSEVMFYNVEAVTEAMKFYKPEFEGSASQIESFLSTMTWDELMELSQVCLDHKDEVSSELEVPTFYDSDANMFITHMYQRSIPYSSVDETTGRGSIDFESGDARTNAEALLTEMKEDFDSGCLTTKGTVGKYGSDYFTNEKCVFSIGSTGGSGYNFPSADSFTVGVARVPTNGPKTLYVSQGPTLCLLRNPGYSDEENDLRVKYAWKLLKFITNGEVNATLCVNGSEGYMPVRLSAYETPMFQDFLNEGEDYAKTMKVIQRDINGRYLITPTFPGSASLRDYVGAMVTAVLSGESTVTNAVQKAIDDTKLKM